MFESREKRNSLKVEEEACSLCPLTFLQAPFSADMRANDTAATPI